MGLLVGWLVILPSPWISLSNKITSVFCRARFLIRPWKYRWLESMMYVQFLSFLSFGYCSLYYGWMWMHYNLSMLPSSIFTTKNNRNMVYETSSFKLLSAKFRSLSFLVTFVLKITYLITLHKNSLVMVTYFILLSFFWK